MKNGQKESRKYCKIIIIICILALTGYLCYQIYQFFYQKQVYENFIYSFQDTDYHCQVAGTSLNVVSIERNDEFLETLEGSIWKLENEKTKKTYTLTTNNKGKTCLVGLPDGNYRLYEDEAPENIVRHSNVYKFTLNNENRRQNITAYTQSNKIAFIIKYVNEYKVPLYNKKLDIYQDDKKIKTLTTNPKGLAGIINLQKGPTYTVKKSDSTDNTAYKMEYTTEDSVIYIDLEEEIKENTK